VRRALSAHHRDMRDRSHYEKIKPPRPGPAGKSADQRCREIRDLAVGLSLKPAEVTERLSATRVVREACSALESDGADGSRLWSLSSGLAHGRHWTILHGYEVMEIVDSSDQYANVLVSANEPLVTDMAKLAHRLFVATCERFALLAESHR
jgi:hypothetical protein